MARILSTKSLTESQQQLLLNTDHSLVHYDAIQISELSSNFPQKPLTNAIVTSQNTARIIIAQAFKIDQLFCVGEKTASLLSSHGYQVVLICEYAAQLAKLITQNYASDTFSLLCSQQRLDTIPHRFVAENMSLTEYHLYETSSRHQHFQNDFDVVLFYSPSGIHSFFEANSEMTSIQAVCIGTTTAEVAKRYVKNVTYSTKTSVESVIVKAVQLLR
ncbi:MAG: uroporphyrinogen-III synthase [Psychroflexus sp.]|nr:uroporphyrinogen-III synthase [Psychroflexus sp.]MDN6309219.1 uroporphyrinogen-III synthase [Psychroflexus sp.]